MRQIKVTECIPYSFDKRPIRFAFLVNPQDEKWAEQLDAIWEYSLDKWRGRFSLVVPTMGETIDADWWEFLKRIDPDYVISTMAISDVLNDRIKAEIHPIDIEFAEAESATRREAEDFHIQRYDSDHSRFAYAPKDVTDSFSFTTVPDTRQFSAWLDI